MTKAAETLEKKIEAQLEKLKQLKARKQAIEAREKSKQKEQQRKDDTRRKILLGSYLNKKMQEDESNKEQILAELNEYLTEDRDRELFNLPIVPKTGKNFEVLKRKFNSYEEASEFLKGFVEPFKVETKINKLNDLWVLSAKVDMYGRHYLELVDIFKNPNYQNDQEDEPTEENNDLEDYWENRDPVEVELDGYPSNYDRSTVNRY